MKFGCQRLTKKIYKNMVNNQVRVFVPTCDNYMWCMRPFAYLFNKYWNNKQQVIFGGFTPPDFSLPPNFRFFQIDTTDYPPKKWSNGMIKMLQSFPDEYIILLLEDYWLNRKVNIDCVNACVDYMKHRPRILRIDLTDDRQYAGGVFDVDAVRQYNIVETPPGTQYQMSTQAGLWRKSLLLELLVPNKTAWETEIHTAPPGNMRVLGTRQKPVQYANALLKGKIDSKEINKIQVDLREVVKKWIPSNMKQSA